MRSIAAAAVLSSVLALACGSDEKKPPAAPTGGTGEPVATTTKDFKPAGDEEKPGDNPNKSQINISDEIKKACGISDSDAYFEFDSANIRPQDQKVLQQLADCFSKGPLKGREMRLVGHADPRGEPEYNMVLGSRRADNVKNQIAQKGLTAEKIATSSRGEMDSSGTDEASWARDRRVDVVLGN
jgi:peptidoglycan-associated lipoprotein